jgi:hypothetical protein
MVDSRRVTAARARPIASRSRSEALDVNSADGEQDQGSAAAPAGELAQVQRVGLAGQAAVPGQEPGEGDSLGVGEAGLTVPTRRGSSIDPWFHESPAVRFGGLIGRSRPPRAKAQSCISGSGTRTGSAGPIALANRVCRRVACLGV